MAMDEAVKGKEKRKMRRKLVILGVCIGVCLSSGCAMIPQTVELSPKVSVAADTMGGGKKIELQVVDERPTEVIGHRGSAYGDMAEIKPSREVRNIFYDEIAKGLSTKGFKVNAKGSNSTIKLRVDIRLLEYKSSQGFFTFGIHTRSTLKAVASKGGDVYEKLYRVDNEMRTMIVPTTGENARVINETVAKVVEKLFADDALLRFLAN